MLRQGRGAGERCAKQFARRGAGVAGAVDDQCGFGQVCSELEAPGPDEIDGGWRLRGHQASLQANGEPNEWRGERHRAGEPCGTVESTRSGIRGTVIGRVKKADLNVSHASGNRTRR